MEILLIIIGIVLAGGIGLFVGRLIGISAGLAQGKATTKEEYEEKLRAKTRADAGIREAATKEAEAIRRQAEQDAERTVKNAEVQAKSLIVDTQSRIETESKRERELIRSEREGWQQERDRERELIRSEREGEREEGRREGERLLRRAESLDERALKLDKEEEQLQVERKKLAELRVLTDLKLHEAESKLYEIAALTQQAAQEIILRRLEEELEEERAIRVKTMMERAHNEVKRRTQGIIAQAIQRSASETTASLSVSVVPIPSDAMKGRIIGREGRNIRAFEALTGVDLIIDDTPEAVILSSFNPIRREVAVRSLAQLVQDGRIHPTRIEEVVARAQDEMKNYILERGEEAAIEANVVGLKPGMLQLLGRMHFRASYAQNVLKHSIQVAHLCGIMAAELGLDSALARRCGLLHDIGKSIDRELEGTHVDIGINLAKRFGEPQEVIDAIAHHHDPENGETVFSVLAAAADAVSAARPGARREDLETYIKRLEQLEQIATSFPGVENAFAIQAGREVRIIVQPERVSDAKATLLAREIANRIEQDMEYPGQVQITVVRETRSVDYAR
jgi:ribonucrease Y